MSRKDRVEHAMRDELATLIAREVKDPRVAAAVIDGPASHVVQQAHNRLHSARGALAFLMGVR